MPEESKNIKKPEKTFEGESKPSDKGKQENKEVGKFIDKGAERKEEKSATVHSLLIRAAPFLFWWIFVPFLTIIILLILGVIGVRVWHLLGPECYVWLGEEKLSDIDKILGAALGGGFIGSRLQKIFPEKSALK